jgi:hypothetical protein
MPNSAVLTDLLAQYVGDLSRGYQATNRSEDRPEYERRLAMAAQLFEALHRSDWERFTEVLSSATRAQGWGFLDGSHGAAAEASLAKLAQQARSG